MRKLFFTTIACLLLVVGMTAQSSDAVGSAKGKLTDCASSLDALLSSVKQIKDKAEAEFKTEQSSIEETKAALKQRRADIEKDNDNEKNMMYDKWPARIQAKQKLIQDEQAVLTREQKLEARRAEFAVHMSQYEKEITDLATEIAKRVEAMTGRAKKDNAVIQGAKF